MTVEGGREKNFVNGRL